MADQMKQPRPLDCTIDQVGVKRTKFDAEELRRFIKNTDEEVFFVETDKDETAPIVVGPLRACLADLEKGE